MPATRVSSGIVLGYNGEFLNTFSPNGIILTDNIKKAKIYYDNERALEDLARIRSYEECEHYVLVHVKVAITTSITTSQ